ncbi:hypothetical protein L226DRAFT_561346 [Lentinus tigrinus ALCF2SS1-7]|uniref:Uncharacterized protein n=1 Tax=Lentinus tigrinus ALCF2SS1-6 TaxID=1328759 RepID=A0A5C2S5J2_9APHY|nr:hypothetical protein L227DRAFT_601689 [Lentinus tigrinus ALCF2SS1-6]RPD73271.1 hypothetical protein L226DRAFT_561346 [Lentinus tigrinus ALCF2SS1-7]
MVQTRSSKKNTAHRVATGSKSHKALAIPQQKPAKKQTSQDQQAPPTTKLKPLVPAKGRKCVPLARTLLRTVGQHKRWEYFQSHPMVWQFNELYALCKLCYLNARLSRNHCYDREHWDKHCVRCLRRDPKSKEFKKDQRKNKSKWTPQLRRWVSKRPAKEKIIPQDVLQALRRKYLVKENSQTLAAASEEDDRAEDQPGQSQECMVVDTAEALVQSHDLTQTIVDHPISLGDSGPLPTAPSMYPVPPFTFHFEEKLDTAPPQPVLDNNASVLTPLYHRDVDVQARRRQLETSRSCVYRVMTTEELPAVEFLLSFQSGNSQRRNSVDNAFPEPNFTLSPVNWATAPSSGRYQYDSTSADMGQQSDSEDSDMTDEGF